MKAKIRWTLEFEYPILGNVAPENLEFYLEEINCQENILGYLVATSEEGKCRLCSCGNVELLEIIEDEALKITYELDKEHKSDLL